MSPTVPRWSRAYPSAAGRRPCGPFRRLPLPLPTPPPSCVVVVGSRHRRRGPSLAAREREKKRKSVKYPILNLGTGAIWHRSLDSEISLKIWHIGTLRGSRDRREGGEEERERRGREREGGKRGKGRGGEEVAPPLQHPSRSYSPAQRPAEIARRASRRQRAGQSSRRSGHGFKRNCVVARARARRAHIEKAELERASSPMR